MAEENPQSLFQQVQAGAASAGATMKKTIVGAADKAAAGAQSMLEGMGDIGSAAAAAGSAIIKGIMNPMVGIVGLFALSLKHLSEAEDRAQGVARATGLTGENLKVAQKQASHLHNRYRIFGATIDESIDSIQAVYNNMGNVDYTTTAAADQIMRFSKGAGVGAETTAKGLANMMLMQGATEDTALNAQLFAKDLANAAGVPLGLVMSDIADISDDVAGYMSANPKELVKATVEARRLGLSLDQTAKMADSLLDFESSIEKEMEAQILTGKQLNYDRARALALQGDSVGAAKDLVDQIGGAAEFNKMNVVQQRALAQSVGLSVGEMKKALGVKDKEAELEEQRAEEMRQAEKDQATGIKMVATTMESFKQLLFDIGKILGDILAPEAESFMTFLKSPEGQRKMKETFITIKEVAIYIKEGLISAFKSFFGYTDEEGVKHEGMWSKIKDVIWAVSAPIRGLLNVAQFVFEEIGALGARLFKAFATYPAKMASIIKSMINGAKTFFKNGIKSLFTGAKSAAKSGGSMFLKVLKKIPVIGALISFGFAISKFKKGDFIGAGLEIASGLASFIPGVGTAVSIGLDVVSGVRDVKMANQQDDFIYSDSKGVIPFNKDDLIIGGTKLDQGLGMAGAGGGGGNVASKLDVIIGLLSKPGVVMLDGKKVGDTLAMAKSYVDD